MPQRTCGVDGCPKPHRARGLCSSHYNQQHQPDRHRKSTAQCTWCGRTCLKANTQRYAERFCSLSCRDTWRRRDRLPVLYMGSEVLPSIDGWTPGRRMKAQAKLDRAALGTRGSNWTSGSCARCGVLFTSLITRDVGRYCSPRCKRRAGNARRRAAERGAMHVRYSRNAIFERDAWRCHLCRRKTDRTKTVPHPKAPTIDHLVPLVEGGADAAANVATACFLCNSKRGHRGGGEQLALM